MSRKVKAPKQIKLSHVGDLMITTKRFYDKEHESMKYRTTLHNSESGVEMSDETVAPSHAMALDNHERMVAHAFSLSEDTTKKLIEGLEAETAQLGQRYSDKLLGRLKYLLRELRANHFGGKNCHLLSGMGRSFLQCEYFVRDYGDDERMAYCDNEVFEYLGESRKRSELVASHTVKAILCEIRDISDAFEEKPEIILPFRVWWNKIEL